MLPRSLRRARGLRDGPLSSARRCGFEAASRSIVVLFQSRLFGRARACGGRVDQTRARLLICDEVQTGVGRTGEWFFAGSAAAGGVVPDVVTLAKALGSGVPVGACLTTETVAAQIKENDLGTTFGGGMLAMAAVCATLEAIEQDDMLA